MNSQRSQSGTDAGAKPTTKKTTPAFILSCAYLGLALSITLYLWIDRYWIDEVFKQIALIGRLLTAMLLIIIPVLLVRRFKSTPILHIVFTLLVMAFMLGSCHWTCHCVDEVDFGSVENEPWPVHLRQGPDTHFAEVRIKQWFRLTDRESDTLSDRYFRSYMICSMDRVHARFRCERDDVIAKIVGFHELVEKPVSLTDLFERGERLPWWPKSEDRGDFESRKFEFYDLTEIGVMCEVKVWYDRKNREVYYTSFY